MKRKIFAIFALVLVVSVIFCGFIVAAEETTASDEVAIGGGDWFSENWKSIAEAALGVGGVAFVTGLVGFINKLAQLRRTLKTTNTDNASIKAAVNGLIDEADAMKNAIDIIRNDNTAAINVLADKTADSAAKTDALCKVVAALVSASALPDATKNYILGDLNAALGYKDGESNVEQSKG